MNNVNFSQVLQNTLKDQLGINSYLNIINQQPIKAADLLYLGFASYNPHYGK
ncbi:hypothetical protein SBF1_3800006 [Candidatus Desulfosporosinus infrequens]|uniref:Uncharacterized protein n=1 Tax=Candidatus Desulfosporosinus infrequens TaxID=2043169 RepID=A0A2U3L5W3_9FIRM|nr:hypothetical protein SBF1_3800006 [Candidatus Desulfosporosinus infrequens]